VEIKKFADTVEVFKTNESFSPTLSIWKETLQNDRYPHQDGIKFLVRNLTVIDPANTVTDRTARD
jgi:hypothetical protein